MTIDTETDLPFGAGRVVERTVNQQGLDDPEEEEIDEDDEEDIMDDPDDSDQLDDADAEQDPYGDKPRGPSTRDLI